MAGNWYASGGTGGFQRTRSSRTRSAFGSSPASSLAPSLIHRATTSAFAFGTASPLSRGGIRRSSSVTMSAWKSLSSGLPGTIASPPAPPAMSFSKVVMSYLPDRFLASWQAKQFSLRIGATSLMKLTGLSAAFNARRNRARSAPSRATAQRKQKRTFRGMTSGLQDGGTPVGWV